MAKSLLLQPNPPQAIIHFNKGDQKMPYSNTPDPAMLAAIIDSSEDAIISKDLNSVITSWNKSAQRMFGYTAEEITGRHINILIPADRQHEEEMIIKSLKAGKRIEHFETVRLTKSGQTVQISLTISPIKNENGQVIGASKIARDISKQKQDEALIRQYAHQLELIGSVSRNISTQLDVNIILQLVTDATTKLSGAAFGAFFYNKTDANGEAYMLYALSGAPREAFEKFGMPRNTAVFKTTFDGIGIVRSDDITKDPRYGNNPPHKGMPKGHLPVVSYLAVPVSSQTGVVIGGLFFGHPQPAMFTQKHEDLVGAIASQAAISLDNAKLYDEVKGLNAKKDEFLGFASHELKTPLTTLHGYIQLGQSMQQVPPGFLDKMSRQVERLRAIVGNLLDISKIKTGKLDFHFIKTSLLGMIHESVEAVDYGSNIFELRLPQEDVEVKVDRQKIIQVITNVLTNAIKYSAPKTTISLEVVRWGDQINISVQDQGMGIPTAELDKIFNQFYRIQSTLGRAEGAGLGLFICKEIMEGHMGSIRATSEVGKGSIFYVSFPIERLNT